MLAIAAEEGHRGQTTDAHQPAGGLRSLRAGRFDHVAGVSRSGVEQTGVPGLAGRREVEGLPRLAVQKVDCHGDVDGAALHKTGGSDGICVEPADRIERSAGSRFINVSGVAKGFAVGEVAK